MNSFGKIFRVSVFGESHGKCVGLLVDNCPAGLELSENDFTLDLKRRMPQEKGVTSRKEQDLPLIKSGVFQGRTTGAPIMILFENNDVDSSFYEKNKNTPRPGHADFVAFKKFGGFNDYRGGGHFSGRLTAALVAGGVIAKKMIFPVKANARLIEAGGSKNIEESIAFALKEHDSIGGIVECRASGLPVGLGETFFDSVESLLSHAVFAIPAVKGIEFGAGFKATEMTGSRFNDEIISADGKTSTNNSGGINGGITNGNELVFRIAIKPTSSIAKPKKSIDLKTGKQTEISVKGRHDACIALRVPVVLEAVTAIVLADLMLLEQKIPRIRGRVVNES